MFQLKKGVSTHKITRQSQNQHDKKIANFNCIKFLCFVAIFLILFSVHAFTFLNGFFRNCSQIQQSNNVTDANQQRILRTNTKQSIQLGKQTYIQEILSFFQAGNDLNRNLNTKNIVNNFLNIISNAKKERISTSTQKIPEMNHNHAKQSKAQEQKTQNTNPSQKVNNAINEKTSQKSTNKKSDIQHNILPKIKSDRSTQLVTSPKNQQQSFIKQASRQVQKGIIQTDENKVEQKNQAKLGEDVYQKRQFRNLQQIKQIGQKVESLISKEQSDKNLDIQSTQPVIEQQKQHQQNKKKQQSNKAKEQPQVKGITTNVNKYKGPTQWPKSNQMYHVYTALNPRLVFDVAQMSNGSHDLILYEWKNTKNQKFYFRQVKENKYKIINAQTNQVMKISQKKVANVARIKFSKQQNIKSQVWELVPLVPSKQSSKNSFHIVSFQGKALDLSKGYARINAQIIVYDFHKKLNQAWILRTNNTQFDLNQKSQFRYHERASHLLQDIMSIPDSFQECITFEEMKLQMSQKGLTIPNWLRKPKLPNVLQEDLPIEHWPQVIQANNLKKQQQEQLKYVQIIKNQILSSQIQVKKEIDKKQFQTKMPETGCSSNHTIAYVWFGNKTMPLQYQSILQNCKNTTFLLTEEHFKNYTKMWNQNNQLKIVSEVVPTRQKINILKLLYLYFESGIYADFDTQINEKCFSQVYADQIVWTNRIDEKITEQLLFPIEQIIVPEQNFMMVRRKLHPQVKKMIEEEIKEHDNGVGDRWRECKYRQCLVISCQRHYRDNTYKKGYD